MARKPDHRGDHGVDVKTIAQGMPGLSGSPDGDDARMLTIISHTRLSGALAPGIPCALFLEGRTI